MKRVGLAAVVLALAMWQAQGAIPQEIHFQGRLTDTGGAPITATLNMTFALYDSLVAVSSLWDEIHVVDVADGMFSVTLGQGTPLTLALFRDNPRLYLGITVDADLEMAPRYPVCTAAYAFVALHAEQAAQATDADTLDTLDSTDFTTDAELSAGLAAKANTADLNDSSTATAPVGWDDIAGKPATYTPSAHNHSAADITSGVLDNARFSAYADLSAEGYLNNDATTDLLTQGQGDGRYLLKTTPASDVGGVNLAAGPGVFYVTPVTHAPLRDGLALVTVDVSFFNVAGGPNTTDGPEYRVCMVPSVSPWVNDGLQGMFPGPLDALGRAGLSRTAVFPVSAAETYRFGAWTGGTPADWVGDAMYMHVTVLFLY